jgi:hypothetical protein
MPVYVQTRTGRQDLINSTNSRFLAVLGSETLSAKAGQLLGG